MNLNDASAMRWDDLEDAMGEEAASATAMMLFAEILRRLERLKSAAETVYTTQDSGTLADLDTALNVLETGIEDCR